MARLFCGTSGFAYATWKPDFYPAKLPAKQFLEYYAGRLNAVEINYTFRRLPSASTLEAWVKATPEGFLFCPKAHMRITHIQRLQKAEFTELFFRALDPLRISRRLGPVLFQLPPQFRADVAVLRGFLDGLPEGLACAFEFRHTSWLTTEVYQALERHGAALCLAESEKLAIPEVLTAAFVYSRLRKTEYAPEERREIAGRVRQLRAGGRDCYVFFKHEDTPAGAQYAEELLRSGEIL
jgi:uncharacterized protein YecE (DUF72 family)